MSAITPIAEALSATREVNGGELESVLTIYTPEGLAVLALNSLAKAGWAIVRTNGVLDGGQYDCDTSSDGYYLTPLSDPSVPGSSSVGVPSEPTAELSPPPGRADG